MTMIAEISAGLSSLKAAKDIVQGLNAAHTQKAVSEIKISLQNHILDAQQSLFAAQQAEAALSRLVSDLEKEIIRLKDWTAERENYQLSAIGGCAFAYVPKPSVKPLQEPHWLCAYCFDNHKKSLLQPQGILDGRLFQCVGCGGTVKVPVSETPASHFARLSGSSEA